MAGTKISDATLRGKLKGTEELPIVDTDLAKGKTTVNALKTFITPDLSSYATKTELAKKLDTATYNKEKSQFALKEEIPKDIEDLVMYGIGNMNLHRTLPIHSQMRGCLLNDQGKVTKYLNSANWTSETRDGSQGQVMVELPMYYRKFETEGNKRRVKLSEYPLPGYHQVKKKYVSAYEATVQRSTTTLCSVVNEDADYRGGRNNEEWDGTYRTLIGRPATLISRTNFRAYARKRKSATKEWNCMTYDIQKDLYWLFVIEYATLNSQAAYNASPTAEGYRQGGLGDGVTTFSDTDWNNFNGRYPFVPCGITDSLGNRTGLVEYTVNNEASESPITKTFNVPRYRGIENPFGHIWQWTDGINVRISPDTESGGDGLSKVFVCDDPSKFNDTNYEGYSHVGNEARTEGYVKEVIFGEGGEIMPKVVGGGSTTYFCDYHYTNIPTAETLRGVLFGGSASHGARAGFAFAGSTAAPSASGTYFGSRLCLQDVLEAARPKRYEDNGLAPWQKISSNPKGAGRNACCMGYRTLRIRKQSNETYSRTI